MNEPVNPCDLPALQAAGGKPSLGVISCALIPIQAVLFAVLLNSNMGVFVTFVFIVSMVIFPLAGLGLGVIAVRRKHGKRLAAVVGIVLNALSLLAGLSLSVVLVVAMLTLS